MKPVRRWVFRTAVLFCFVGTLSSWASSTPGIMVAWGWNGYGQTDVPPGLSNVVGVAVGVGHSLALQRNGKVAPWGWNNRGQATVPTGLSNVVAIAAGFGHSLALRNDGTVVASQRLAP